MLLLIVICFHQTQNFRYTANLSFNERQANVIVSVQSIHLVSVLQYIVFLSVVCFAILIIHFMHLFVKNLLCLVLYYLLGHIYWIILFYPFDPICCVILEYYLCD